MPTKRYALMQHLVERVRSITLENDYRVTINQVFQQVGALGDEVRDQLPVAAVVEAPEQPEVVRRGGDDLEHQALVFIVQAWAAQDEEATSEPAYELLAALQRCLRPLERSAHRPANTVKVRVAPGYVTVPDQATWSCSCVVEVTIEFRDELGEPYV